MFYEKVVFSEASICIFMINNLPPIILLLTLQDKRSTFIREGRSGIRCFLVIKKDRRNNSADLCDKYAKSKYENLDADP